MNKRDWNRREFLGATTAWAGASLGVGWASRVVHGQPAGSPGDVGWLAEVQQPPQTPVVLDPPLPALLSPPGEPVISSVDEWRPARARLRAKWLEFLGPMPETRPELQIETVAEEQVDGVLRRRVRYRLEEDLTVEAYLLIPGETIPGRDPRGRRAGIVALHPTTNNTIDEIAGVKGEAKDQLGLQLARAGFVVSCPLCFLWHHAPSLPAAVESFKARHPQALGMRKMLYDAQRGVDLLVAHPELVDARRIGAVGHSLGAKETLYLAAFDDRVRTGVFSEGGIGFSSTNWNASWYLGKAIEQPGFPLNHAQLLALIAPRPFLLLGGESGPGAADGDRSWPYVEAALPVYRLHGQPPRLGLLNHREGHSLSANSLVKVLDWLTTYTA
ncbi:MAG: dienelactone hydrolase family protein [Planctomycetaceae bacterium]